MLRVVDDEVQTSLGARFPVSHAMHALAFIRKVRESGQEYIRNGHSQLTTWQPACTVPSASIRSMT